MREAVPKANDPLGRRREHLRKRPPSTRCFRDPVRLGNPPFGTRRWTSLHIPSLDTLLVPRWSHRWPSGRGLSAAGHQTVRDSGNDLRHRLPTPGGALKPTALAAAAIRGICSVTVSTASRLKLSVHVFGRGRPGSCFLAIYRSFLGHDAAFPAVPM